MHRGAIQQYAELALGKLGGEVISRLFYRRRIICILHRGLVGVKLRLRFGLRRTFAGRRLCRALRRRPGLSICLLLLIRCLLRLLGKCQAGPGQQHQDHRCLLHVLSSPVKSGSCLQI
jgi:hypothetical protein